MNDFDYEVMQRKRIAGGARHRKCGSKSKYCSLPTDHMTPKQWRERCGSVVTYQLNRPIPWTAFKEMPQDIQKSYIEKVMESYSPTATDLARLFGVTATTVTKYLGVCFGIKFSPGKKMPKDRIKEFDRFISQEEAAAEENVQDNAQVQQMVEPVNLLRAESNMRMSEFSLVFDGEFNIESIHNSIVSMIPKGAMVRIEVKCAIENEFPVAKSQEVA